MTQTKRKKSSKKILPIMVTTLTSSLIPRSKTFSPKKKLPKFKLLTSGLSPATRFLLRKPKSSKRPLNILEAAKRLQLNAYAKSYSPPKKREEKRSHKRKGKRKGKKTRKKRKGKNP